MHVQRIWTRPYPGLAQSSDDSAGQLPHTPTSLFTTRRLVYRHDTHMRSPKLVAQQALSLEGFSRCCRYHHARITLDGHVVSAWSLACTPSDTHVRTTAHGIADFKTKSDLKRPSLLATPMIPNTEHEHFSVQKLKNLASDDLCARAFEKVSATSHAHGFEHKLFKVIAQLPDPEMRTGAK